MLLNKRARHFIIGTLPLAAVIIVLYAAFDSEREALHYFRIHKWKHEDLRQAFFFITDYGKWAFYVFYAGLLVYGLVRRRREYTRLALIFAVFQVLICSLLINLLKIALGRPRPEAEDEFYNLLTADAYYHSLPSGHTAEIFGAVTPLILWAKRLPASLALGAAAALVAFSRIYLYQHYPSDVAFGWAFGVFSGWAVYEYWLHKEGK